MATDKIVFASYEEVEKIAKTHAAVCFVWPDEGDFKGEKWEFNPEHKGDFEPLLIDATTANVLVKVIAAVKPETAEILKGKISEGRGSFGWFIEKAWKCVG